jgi:4-cresol dehydrogenase (hydroxylating) flavoprotein subunit
MSNLAAALGAWRERLGSDRVCVDEDVRAVAETSTFATTQRIPAILHPASREEVQDCLRIASDFLVPLYPISCGKNWGSGSRVPVRDDCVLLDLGQMNRILDFDEELAYVTVEPGVSFGQLFSYLQEHRSNLMMGAPGTTPDASVIGNTMERGHGGGLQVDRFAHVCALEIVLPTGECIHTGFDRFPNARAASLHRWGVGPAMDGLFTQSNLGVVTKLSLWLVPRPPFVQSCFFRVTADDSLDRLLPGVRQLCAIGEFAGFVSIWNRYKGIALQNQYPWERTDKKVPLPAELMDRLPGGDIGWTGLAGLYANTRRQAKEQRAIVRSVLRPVVDQLLFCDHERLLVYRGEGAKQFGGQVALCDPRQSLFLGVPTHAGVQTIYWRKRSPPPAIADPDRDRCGLLTCLPSIPFRSADVRAAVRIAEQGCLSHGFEPNIALICTSERNIDATVMIMYDRDVEGEDAKARACHDKVLSDLVESGYIPYRLGIQSMSSLPPVGDDSRLFRQRLKRMIDPKSILAPGRYEE